jgi:YD repeat-containing protein
VISVEDAYGTIAYYDYDYSGNLLKMIDPQGITISISLRCIPYSKLEPIFVCSKQPFQI